MEWYEQLGEALETITSSLAGSIKTLIKGEDRPPNWQVRIRVNDEKEWRGPNGQKRRDDAKDPKPKT
jgi:hypothetical protein